MSINAPARTATTPADRARDMMRERPQFMANLDTWGMCNKEAFDAVTRLAFDFETFAVFSGFMLNGNVVLQLLDGSGHPVGLFACYELGLREVQIEGFAPLAELLRTKDDLEDWLQHGRQAWLAEYEPAKRASE